MPIPVPAKDKYALVYANYENDIITNYRVVATYRTKHLADIAAKDFNDNGGVIKRYRVLDI